FAARLWVICHSVCGIKRASFAQAPAKARGKQARTWVFVGHFDANHHLTSHIYRHMLPGCLRRKPRVGAWGIWRPNPYRKTLCHKSVCATCCPPVSTLVTKPVTGTPR